jgi:hypothetical protein
MVSDVLAIVWLLSNFDFVQFGKNPSRYLAFDQLAIIPSWYFHGTVFAR